MSNRITRRATLSAGLAAGAAACSRTPEKTSYSAATESANGIFSHGVASGDPDQTSIVLWTRLSLPQDAASIAPVNVVWQIASDPDFVSIMQSGEAATGTARDWTVKTIANGLEPGGSYYFRFHFGDTFSPVGKCKTLPAGVVEQVRFAIVSCSNYQYGFFNVYDLISRRDDFDAVIHLGDYIYEYGVDGYGGDVAVQIDRRHEPAHEIVTLDDYRRRHGQYKSDPSSQAMHAAHPMIPIWDDHEVANNSWRDGAENHNPNEEGDWEARRLAALQAYYEWMPIREPEPGKARESMFKSYNFGDLLSLTSIETRLMARDKQFQFAEVVKELNSEDDARTFMQETIWDPSRKMLGATQVEFIKETLRQSVAQKQHWRLLANQILMAEVISPDLNPFITEEDIQYLETFWDQARDFIKGSGFGLPANLDAWDGYPAARENFYKMVREANAEGVLVLTGDTHTWWANDLHAKDGAHMGVEFGVHSVTSPSEYDENFLDGKGGEYALLTTRDNKDVRYLSGNDHGFIDLTIDRNEARARLIAVDTILQPEYGAFEKATFRIKRTKQGIKYSGVSGLGIKERFLFG